MQLVLSLQFDRFSLPIVTKQVNTAIINSQTKHLYGFSLCMNRKHKYSHLAFIITQTMAILSIFVYFCHIFFCSYWDLVFYRLCPLQLLCSIEKCFFNLYERRNACLMTFNSFNNCHFWLPLLPKLAAFNDVYFLFELFCKCCNCFVAFLI